jgi:hypothetical protein
MIVIVLFACLASWLSWTLYQRREAKDRRRRATQPPP